MIRIIIIIIISTIIFSNSILLSQNNNEVENNNINSVNKMLSSNKKLTIGGYAQIDYNQPFGDNSIQNGTLDVHRMVLLFGYRFTSKLNFITELEIEHVKEVYVEQAFLNYSFNTYLQVRAGLLLVPMGIINQYHEPTTFNGVERPLIDKYIAPTTWREIGIGITGTIPELSIRYQTYLMNGFSSYNGSAQLSGQDGLRKGRQKGVESIIKTPVSASRVEYYGVLGLTIGLSAYIGKTQSSLYSKIDKADAPKISQADSSIVQTNMFGFDASYQNSGLLLKFQTYYTNLNNTFEYNNFTSSDGNPNDLGSSMYGYYVEASYNIFQQLKKINSELIVFARYSTYDTQYEVATGITKNLSYKKQVITTGIGWKLIPEVAIKADVQFLRSEAENNYSKLFNVGIAVWF